MRYTILTPLAIALASGGGDPGVAAQRCAIYRRQGLDWRPIDAERVR